MYLQFDTLWPLYNSDVEDLTKLNSEISIESAGVCVCGGIIHNEIETKQLVQECSICLTCIPS